MVGKNENLQHIGKAEAEPLSRQCVATAERAMLRLIHVPLTDGQFDAFVSFTFNLGGVALSSPG
jgi:lysozyme